MAFEETLYQSENGEVYRIRLDDDTLASAGPAPTFAGDKTKLPFVQVSKSKRQFGMSPRLAVYKFTEETDGGLKATATKRIPLLLPTTNPPATITDDGRTYELKSRVPEDV